MVAMLGRRLTIFAGGVQFKMADSTFSFTRAFVMNLCGMCL